MPAGPKPTEQNDSLSQLVPDDAPPVPFWRTLARFTRPYHRKLVLGCTCALLVGVAVALQPMVVKFVVDDGINRTTASGEPAPPAERLKWALVFAGVYLGLGVVRISIWMVGYRRLNAAVEGFVFDLRSRFFRHVQRLCLRFHDQVSSGELFNYIMGSPISSLKMFLRQGGMVIPYQLVSWCVAVGVLMKFNWAMTLITIAMAVTVVLINRHSKGVIREMSSDFLKTESHVSRYVADMLRGSRAVKIYAMERDVAWSFDDQAVRIRDQGIRLANRQQLEGVKPEVVHYAGIACIYAAGAWFCVYRGMQVGTFLAFVGSVSLLMGPLMNLTRLNLVRGNAEAGLERIVRVLQVDTTTPEVPDEISVEVDDQRELAREEDFPFVVTNHLWFEYEPGQPVLRDVSLRVPPGQSVALVGPSGSGKTTFVSLLLRLYDPTRGRILLNGIDLFHYTLKELRASFG
ncbi:MAG: ABC transporter ATP-binding protein, partial [Planctomycetota bacterium]